MIAADTLGSYGSLARFRDISRLMKVNDSTLVGGFGDFADFQHIMKLLKQQTIDDEVVGMYYVLSFNSLSLMLIVVLNSNCLT